MPSPHPSDRPVQRAHNLLRQEVVETRQRARLGGWFYGVAAALAFGVTGFGPGDRLAAVLVIVGLLVLAVIRVLIPLTAEPDAAQARRYLHRVWAVILATTLVWSGFSAWSQAALPAPAPLITLLFSGAFGMARPCTNCGGTGEVIEDPCPTCGGTGTVRRTRSITVRIPAGVTDGQKVRLAGQGEAGPNGTPAGDLFVTVHVRDDDTFTRSDDDLEVTVPVSFAEAALGATVAVPTLDNPVKVKVPAGTPNGRTLRVRGRGIPKKSGAAGDLLVTVEVQVPKDLDPSATSALRAYAQAEKDSGFDPRAGFAGN